MLEPGRLLVEEAELVDAVELAVSALPAQPDLAAAAADGEELETDTAGATSDAPRLWGPPRLRRSCVH
jgi:hypothetical protein